MSFFVELMMWLEHTTCWLRISCSTDWATLAYLCDLPGSLQSENYFITVSFCRQLVIFNFRRRSIFAAFCIIRSVFCRKSCKIFRCRSLCSLSVRWNASDSAKKTCWDLPKKFRQFLSLFSVDFLFLPLLPLVFHLHNFFDNSLLQRVIHIFHMVFNIYIFLIFQ